MYTYLLESQWQSMFLSIRLQKEPKQPLSSIQEQQKTFSISNMLNGYTSQSKKCSILENCSMLMKPKTKQDNYSIIVINSFLFSFGLIWAPGPR